MADVLERARAALQDWRHCQAHNTTPPYPAALLAGLVVELETARAQRDQNLVDFTKNYVYMHEQLEVARAEAERLRAELAGSVWFCALAEACKHCENISECGYVEPVKP